MKSIVVQCQPLRLKKIKKKSNKTRNGMADCDEACRRVKHTSMLSAYVQSPRAPIVLLRTTVEISLPDVY